MNYVLIGFEKAAGFEMLSKVPGALSSMWKQLASGGARVAKSGVGAGKAVGGLSAGVAKNAPAVGQPLVNRGAAIVGNRIRNRALVGAAVGAGGSMVQQKMRGEDISLGRAAVGGALGAGVGAALGTTVGARGFRRLTSPGSTPNMSFRQAANPAGWMKKAPDVMAKATGGSSKNFAAGGLVTKGRSAFGALSPLDKGFLGLNAYEGAKALTSKEHEGHRGEAFGNVAGSAASMLTGSRWGALRRGGMGSTAKSIGLYAGGGFAGGRLGKVFDKKEEVPGAP